MKMNPIIKDMNGKRIAEWVETRDGGQWIMRPEHGSELEYLSCVIIAFPPKEKIK